MCNPARSKQLLSATEREHKLWYHSDSHANQAKKFVHTREHSKLTGTDWANFGAVAATAAAT